MPPYRELYPAGSNVVIADRQSLETFVQSWHWHNPLVPEQLQCAGQLTVVQEVGFYHGGDPLYSLEGVPGVWHEECLRAATGAA